MSKRLTPEEMQPCFVCLKPAVHSIGVGLRITVDRLSVDRSRAQVQAGLETMLGGNASIAAAIGDRAVIDCEPLDPVFVCGICMGAVELMTVVTSALRSEGMLS